MYLGELFDTSIYDFPSLVGDISDDVGGECLHFWHCTYDKNGLPYWECRECGEVKAFQFPQDGAKVTVILVDLVKRTDYYRKEKKLSTSSERAARFQDAIDAVEEQRKAIANWWDGIKGEVIPSIPKPHPQNRIDGIDELITNPSIQKSLEETDGEKNPPGENYQGGYLATKHKQNQVRDKLKKQQQKRRHGEGTGSIYTQTRKSKKGTVLNYYLKVQEWVGGKLIKQYSKYIPRHKLEGVKCLNREHQPVTVILDFIESRGDGPLV
jgi:hypothetical protein